MKRKVGARPPIASSQHVMAKRASQRFKKSGRECKASLQRIYLKGCGKSFHIIRVSFQQKCFCLVQRSQQLLNSKIVKSQFSIPSQFCCKQILIFVILSICHLINKLIEVLLLSRKQNGISQLNEQCSNIYFSPSSPIQIFNKLFLITIFTTIKENKQQTHFILLVTIPKGYFLEVNYQIYQKSLIYINRTKHTLNDFSSPGLKGFPSLCIGIRLSSQALPLSTLSKKRGSVTRSHFFCQRFLSYNRGAFFQYKVYRFHMD
eukprot:TRINITY_DN1165_c0_g2_i16.p1 TRINITY_DN1165_c0_g2~~TRINITY_DN1165_c0_g2_i16.p1  ORF type:complete len:261 (+),score=-29.57 TRINITY_DN1165_c0_g2_i16:799-1581(+)